MNYTQLFQFQAPDLERTESDLQPRVRDFQNRLVLDLRSFDRASLLSALHASPEWYIDPPQFTATLAGDLNNNRSQDVDAHQLSTFMSLMHALSQPQLSGWLFISSTNLKLFQSALMYSLVYKEGSRSRVPVVAIHSKHDEISRMTPFASHAAQSSDRQFSTDVIVDCILTDSVLSVSETAVEKVLYWLGWTLPQIVFVFGGRNSLLKSLHHQASLRFSVGSNSSDFFNFTICLI